MFFDEYILPCIAEPRAELAPSAPKLITIHINPDKIGAVIGATIDTAQMIQILKYADVFYNKRFLLEKEERINMLLGKATQPALEEVVVVDSVVAE